MSVSCTLPLGGYFTRIGSRACTAFRFNKVCVSLTPDSQRTVSFKLSAIELINQHESSKTTHRCRLATVPTHRRFGVTAEAVQSIMITTRRSLNL